MIRFAAFATLAAAIAAFAASAASVQAERAAPVAAPGEADQRLVDRCNAAAADAPLPAALVARCSEAYERLLARHGGYAAYVAARRAREAETE